MVGVNLYQYMQEVSMRMIVLRQHGQFETVPHENDLLEVILPQRQDKAKTLIAVVREKLANVG